MTMMKKEEDQAQKAKNKFKKQNTAIKFIGRKLTYLLFKLWKMEWKNS